MWNYLLAMALILCLMVLWLAVQMVARRYARNHPEYGVFREEGKGCGNSCSCTGRCKAKKTKTHK